MSGALFVITIPMEDKEERTDQRISFDTHGSKITHNSLSCLSELKEKYKTPTFKPSDIKYGTFNQSSTASITPKQHHVTKSIAINLECAPENGIPKHKRNSNGRLSNYKSNPKNLQQSLEGAKDIVSSASRRQSAKKRKDFLFELDIPSDSSMEVVLREILKMFKIENSTWTISNNNKFFQVIFAMEHDEKYEILQNKLHEWGIGDRAGSTVSIIHCTSFCTYKKEVDSDEENSAAELKEQKKTLWNRFMSTLTARINVSQIIRAVRQDATITFDFVILVVCAAILASFGLVEDSTIFLASSMLVSPLMGPIIATIFGTAIEDRSLLTLGAINEFIGIALATFVGFLFGLIVCTVDDRYGIGEGLTTEMLSRCEFHSVIVGILTAIPSGAAAAVGILGGNWGSLVGVAISASLLPPAVNSGILWALACVYLFYETDGTRYNNVVKTNFYSSHQGAELAILGTVSMCVTITNVICVYVMGIIVLKIKEIAPLKSKSRQFWKHDIKIAREINKNCFVEDSTLGDEIAALPDEDRQAFGINNTLFKSYTGNKSSYQNTWSPMGSRHAISFVESKPSVQELERLYFTMAHPLRDNNRLLR